MNGNSSSYQKSFGRSFVIPGKLARPGIQEFKIFWIPVFTGNDGIGRSIHKRT
jgi:hypothetical protein